LGLEIIDDAEAYCQRFSNLRLSLVFKIFKVCDLNHFRAMVLTPAFETPIDTAQQIVENNLVTTQQQY